MNRKLAASLLAASSPVTGIVPGFASLPAAAQAQPAYDFHVGAGSLASALRAIATRTGRSIAAVDAAVERLLAGSGLRARAVGDGLVVEADPAARASALLPSDDIVVTGSRIRGAPVASPVITLGRKAMRDAGQTNLGDVVRAVPQSFSGGQNPGVGANVPRSRCSTAIASPITARGRASM
jgi:iron complex outermembrane recepter protein